MGLKLPGPNGRAGSSPAARTILPHPKMQKASPEGLAFLFNPGAGEGTRTPDPIITNDVLYQLSYTGIWLCRAG